MGRFEVVVWMPSMLCHSITINQNKWSRIDYSVVESGHRLLHVNCTSSSLLIRYIITSVPRLSAAHSASSCKLLSHHFGDFFVVDDTGGFHINRAQARDVRLGKVSAALDLRGRHQCSVTTTLIERVHALHFLLIGRDQQLRHSFRDRDIVPDVKSMVRSTPRLQKSAFKSSFRA